MLFEEKNEKIIGNTPSVLTTSSLIIPPANIAPPINAIQSPAFSGNGKIVFLLNTKTILAYFDGCRRGMGRRLTHAGTTVARRGNGGFKN